MIHFLENNTRPFRHWLTSHEALLLGGSLGFFHSGPIGFVIGAWLGNYVSEKIQSTQQQVQRATQVVQPIVAPISFVSNKLQNLWQLTRDGYQALTQPRQSLAQPQQSQDSHPPTLPPTLKLRRDKGQPTVVEDSHPPTLPPTLKLRRDNPNPSTLELQRDNPNPSMLQRAGDLLDMMNGYADDSVYEQYGDSWLTRDISELPSVVFNQFRGLTQRWWSQPATSQVEAEANADRRSTLH